MLKSNTRITNVHGSMEGQNILKKIAGIEKENKSQDKHERTTKRKYFIDVSQSVHVKEYALQRG